MSILTAEPRALGRTRFNRTNPLARLVGPAVFGLVNVVTLDAVTPLVTLVLVVACIPATGLSPRQILRVSWPLWVAAMTLLVVNTLAYPAPGVGVEDVTAGMVTALRLLAIAWPGVLAFATIDPVDLVDALVQQLHVSARFGYGSLAAMRLLPLLGQDWRSQALAARARGVTPEGAVGRVKALFQRILVLLVSALRRATRLAVALDARGFDSATRARGRPSSWTPGDTALSVAGVLAGVTVVAFSSMVGSWDPMLG